MSGRNNVTTNSSRLRVLYDGWPLVRSPGSPAAFHLIEILSLTADAVDVILALPGDLDLALPDNNINVVVEPVVDSPAGQLAWEQIILPGLARKSHANLLHITGVHPALFSQMPCLVSPSAPVGLRDLRRHSFWQRLRESLGAGGLASAYAILWPDDLPSTHVPGSVQRLVPLLHPAYRQLQKALPDLPEEYIFCPGPLFEDEIEKLAAAWEWVFSGVGDSWGIVVSHVSDSNVALLRERLGQKQISTKVFLTAPVMPEQRSSVFQHAGVVLLLSGVCPWGDSYLHGLASQRPLVAEESLSSDARIGPAGYLVPAGNQRAMGAALLTLLVAEDVSEQVVQQAQMKIHKMPHELYLQQLLGVYARAAKV